ncbi:hypothetical protein AMQ83_22495 [Paenibacillus riograndensis]|nr:hypothetical protein AMQ83_22495 [Paenibacillus riograndensis]
MIGSGRPHILTKHGVDGWAADSVSSHGVYCKEHALLDERMGSDVTCLQRAENNRSTREQA